PQDPCSIPMDQTRGDKTNPKLDDGTSEAIALSIPFTFYGKTHQTAFVNNNGVISFDEPVRQYTPDPFPLADGSPFVTPFWADVDNVEGGDIFYRQSTDPALLGDISQHITQYFPESPFTATWAFVATWDRVAYWGSKSDKVRPMNTSLTFIIIILRTRSGTISPPPPPSPPTCAGVPPSPAGFNSGDDTNFYNIPGSQTDAIINITTTSNVKVPGRWVFRVDDFQAPDVDPPQTDNNCWL
ncbi:SNED1 protein, partial [Pheucticus melanocephalus]|nr:SNED1 protein [Pheucticus melanocephalus]